MFGIGNKSSYGIDIGTQTIKIAEVHKSGGKFEIANYVMWNDSLDEVLQEKSGKHISSAKHISEIIQHMMSESGMNIEQAYIAIPSYLSFSAVINLPLMTAEELANAVPLEAKQYIPVPLEDVQIDWINLGKNEKTGGIQILLMAIPNTVVAKYLKIAKLLKLEVKGFELDIFSQMRSISLSNVSTCIIDIGARSGMVSVLDKDHQLLLTRSFDIGGNHLTNQIADKKGVLAEEAEKLKKIHGLVGDDPDVVQVIQEVLRRFIFHDVANVLDEYERKNDSIVEEIVIVGGISRMKGVRDFIEQQIFDLKNEYRAVKILTGIPTDKLVVKDKKLESVFNTRIWQDLSLAIGIALREFN